MNNNEKKERLDVLVHERKLAESRNQAQRLIMAGQVLVNGQLNDKPSDKVFVGAAITLREKNPFVSRGGEKLQRGLFVFERSDLEGWVCVDVGASTGGFTDCLLQHGASKVYAIDVGYGQLHWSLRQNQRVVNMERTNARYVEHLPEKINMVVIDASFISLKTFWPVFPRWLGETGGEVIALIKPQFEAGRKEAARGEGVIRDAAVQHHILMDVLESAQSAGYQVCGLTESPVRGPKGNREFLVWLTYPKTSDILLEPLVESIHLTGNDASMENEPGTG